MEVHLRVTVHGVPKERTVKTPFTFNQDGVWVEVTEPEKIKLDVGQHWRNDWNDPFSNPWNARIIEIRDNGTLFVSEWLADDPEINRVEWDEGNFCVFYTRLISE